MLFMHESISEKNVNHRNNDNDNNNDKNGNNEIATHDNII